MDDIERKSERAIPGLRQWCIRSVELADELTSNGEYSESDHFGFMVVSFLSMQKTHMKSLLLLSDSRDSSLIVRTMIEGMCQLLWASGDPEERGLRWRAFSWILDWREMREEIANGKKIEAKTKSEIERAIKEYGDIFLTKKARKMKQAGADLPDDPFVNSWSSHPISTIIDFVSQEGVHRRFYSQFSDWLHWSPAGLAQAIERGKNRVTYTGVTNSEIATALANGFQCLVEMLQIYDRHFDNSKSTRVSQLIADYLQWSQPVAKKASL